MTRPGKGVGSRFRSRQPRLCVSPEGGEKPVKNRNALRKSLVGILHLPSVKNGCKFRGNRMSTKYLRRASRFFPEGHLAADGLGLLGHEDHAEAAFADLLQELVGADDGAGGFGAWLVQGSALGWPPPQETPSECGDCPEGYPAGCERPAGPRPLDAAPYPQRTPRPGRWLGRPGPRPGQRGKPPWRFSELGTWNNPH